MTRTEHENQAEKQLIEVSNAIALTWNTTLKRLENENLEHSPVNVDQWLKLCELRIRMAELQVTLFFLDD